MVSMKQIAERCGVSVATVSKALNNHNDISVGTRDRIAQIAQEMGYYPNVAARTLKTNRSYNIGVLFSDAAHSGLTHDYFSAVLESFKNEAESHGYDITFINTNDTSMSYLERCRQRCFDGVVIACIDFTKPGAIELMNADIPTVTIDYNSNFCSSVTSDNQSGIAALVEYVIQQGHKRIAYVHGDSASAVTKTRLAGFYRTLADHNITIPNEYVCASRYLDVPLARHFTEVLLKLKIPPTCILYPDDTALIGGSNCIREMGLKIPDDVSIAGFDGLKVSRYLDPKIATYRQNTTQIGSRAATQLISQIENPKTTLIERIVISGSLITGESVTPPKKIR
jgi:LacI family transcriptional regulator